MSKSTILIVEDEAIIAKEIEFALRGFGHEVLGIIHRGEDAVAYALEHRPDLILMDIMLAGDMDGVEAASTIRAEAEIPIVFSTAYTDQETVKRVLPSAPYGYLAKPFEHTDLRITVETALYKSKMERKLKSQELRLRQAQKMEAVGTLASGIAHDFNNILSAIIGYSEMGLQRVEPSNSLHKMLDRIHRAGRRAQDLVQMLLDFSRPAQLDHSPVDLTPLVEEALGMLEGTRPPAVNVIRDILPGPHLVSADPVQMHQVIMNLLKNAVDALRDCGGDITVSLRSGKDVALDRIVCGASFDVPTSGDPVERSLVMFGVSDTGAGMSLEVRDRAFDPFFTTKPSGQGTGMGLAVVHGLVQSYNGALSLDSGPDGTSLFVFFPESHSGHREVR